MSSRGSLHTRFAPSPTGGFHLGHALHMIWVWGSADLVGAELLIRIEDHDQSRCRPAYFEAMLSDLKWLKLKA
ncbi:MAG: tRNA glutamyl-Q(34) synthetase GluQRS, partial [Actinobacteria bacterium]|nr:tRNA glutamyl-Q(34) synthetase GluQRS [Actinomycetota bacterium]